MRQRGIVSRLERRFVDDIDRSIMCRERENLSLAGDWTREAVTSNC